MLEGLDRIDWTKLDHAYGPAVDVPEQLRALLDAKERDRALYELNGNIVHQGTRYAATPHAVPFLAEIVAARDLGIAVRAPALDLLTRCVAGWLSPTSGPYNGSGPIDEPATTPTDAPPASERHPGDDAHIALLTAIDDAASRALGTMRALLDDEHAALRVRAACFLACFRTRAVAAELVPALARRLAVEEVATVRAHLVFALGHVLPADETAPLLAIHDDESEAFAVRVMAAVWLARRGVATDAAVVTLARALESDADADIDSPLDRESLAADAAAALERVGSRAAGALPALTARLAGVSDFEATSLVRTALAIAFGDGRAPADATSLTEGQRALLEALVHNDEGFWTLGNALTELSDKGLPSMREDMAAYLGVTFAHDVAAAQLRQAELMLGTFHDFESALQHAERALTVNPMLGRAHLVKASCLHELGDTEASMSSFMSAIPLVEGKDRALARRNAAVLLAQHGRRAEGIALERENVAERPDDAEAWYGLGLSCVKERLLDECIDAITKSLALDDGFANAHYTIACAWALRGQPGDDERALAAIRRSIELDEDTRAQIREDEDFARLRGDARFVALVES